MPTSEDMLAGAPPMKVRDAAAWEEARQLHGPEIVGFAERFAGQLEASFAAGKPIATVGKVIMAQANTGCLDKLMINCAVRLLVEHWPYSERLRRWYNLMLEPKQEGHKANAAGVILTPRMLVDF